MDMNIRQAARWAERKGILVRTGADGQPDYLYAVYDTGTHKVVTIGSYDKCKAVMPAWGQPTADGRWLRMEALETICSEMDESDGEASCIPERADILEWA